MTRVLTLDDLDDRVLAGLLAAARQFEMAPRSRALAGRVLGLLFLNPSLRTLASMQAAMAQLGGSAFVVTAGQGSWQLETRRGVVMDGDAAEHIREAIPVLSRYCDVLGVRCFAAGRDLDQDLADPVIAEVAALCPVPLLNLESSMAHPCQSLADWKTLDDLGVPANGGRFVLSWAGHPKALPLAVPVSTLLMAARRGMDVTVLRPDGFGLPAPVMAGAARLAAAAGGSVRETKDREEALEGCHVLYAKSWTAPAFYGRPAEEREHRRRQGDWCVSEAWFRGAARGARFMHCLPVRRNVVVADEVLDGPRSVVVRQAGNRLHVQKALLLHLLGAKETVS